MVVSGGGVSAGGGGVYQGGVCPGGKWGRVHVGVASRVSAWGCLPVGCLPGWGVWQGVPARGDVLEGCLP